MKNVSGTIFCTLAELIFVNNIDSTFLNTCLITGIVDKTTSASFNKLKSNILKCFIKKKLRER